MSAASGRPSLADEIGESLRGALLLGRRDPGGMRHFDLTVEGFWRSFLAIPLAYPAFLVMAYCERNLLAQPPALGRYMALESAAYVLQGLVFPLVMAFLARFLRLTGTYVPFVIAYNWSGIWVAAMLLPPLVLLGFGIVGGALGGLLNILASIVSVYYRWLVARIALNTGGFTALALIVIDMVLSILIALGAQQLYLPAPV